MTNELWYRIIIEAYEEYRESIYDNTNQNDAWINNAFIQSTQSL